MRITLGGLESYDKDSPHGIAFTTEATRGVPGAPSATIELSHYDAAFALCAFIDRYGLANVRAAIDRIAESDPTGRAVGLSAPMRILQGIDPRKAG